MTDLLTILQVAGAAIAKSSNPAQTCGDLITLYGVSNKIKAAGKFDPAVMVKDGSLQAVVEAGARTLTLVDALLKDPAQAPRVTALLQSFA